MWGLNGSQQQVLRVGLGVWKIPSAAVFLKSLWGLPSSKMDSAKARCHLLKFWLVEAGSPAALSSSAMPFHVSRMRFPPPPLWVSFFFLTFHFLRATPCPATSLI